MSEALDPKPATCALPPRDVLRRNVIDKLDPLSDLEMAEMHDFLVRQEMQRPWREIQGDNASHNLTADGIEEAIREHRRAHPYGR